jgi:hypothetical protein
MKITGAQIRAVRAFLRWTIADLAMVADVGHSTIQEVEKIDRMLSVKEMVAHSFRFLPSWPIRPASRWIWKASIQMPCSMP